MKTKTITTILLSALLLVACTGMEFRRENMLREGHPPAYVDGNMDGCASGKSAAGAMSVSFTKDVMRFQRDSLYAQGWGDGFETCRSEYQAWRRTMRY